MVLVVLFPLPDEKNVDVKTIFTCSQTCLLEMNPRVLTLHRIAETRIASRQATALDNEKDGSLAKGGLNGGHRPPLPCDLPMGGFPYEFGPETGR